MTQGLRHAGTRGAAGLAVMLVAASTPAAEPFVATAFLKVDQTVDVPARVAGVIATLPAREGGRVEADAVVATIDARDVAIRVRRVEAEIAAAEFRRDDTSGLEFARKSLARATSELKRAEETRRAVTASVSLSEMEELRLDVDRAAAEIEKHEHDLGVAEREAAIKRIELEEAEHELDRHAARGPIAGFVEKTHAEAGEWVEAGAPLVTIVRLDRLRAEAFLPYAAAAKIAVGDPVAVRAEGDGAGRVRRYDGSVAVVFPEVDPVLREVRVRVVVDCPGRDLRPGAEVEFTFGGGPAPAAAEGAAGDGSRS